MNLQTKSNVAATKSSYDAFLERKQFGSIFIIEII